MEKYEALQALSFGKRVAEDEGEELSSYFVETDQWQQIFSGEVDIIYGAKGSGKSAIYSLLLDREESLFDDRGVMVVPAENPRGAPAFTSLVDDPPAGEAEFRDLWKLYFLSLIARHLRDYGISNELTRKLVDPLEDADLIPKEASLRTILRSVVTYVRNLSNVESYEGGVQLDPTTVTPKATAKVTLREPSQDRRRAGWVSADDLLGIADAALRENDLRLWLLLDRLDVAFAETTALEGNALRALFRVYLDLLSLTNVSLKIFLRSDIWRRISRYGFREASHVTRRADISWDSASLLNLVVRRALHNDELQRVYKVTPSMVLRDADKQSELFYRIFPRQVDGGPKNPETLKWMLSRTSDGSNQSAPRELIHLLTSAREVQLRRLELGGTEPPDETLFERGALKEALPAVSNARFEQTLCAEYPIFQDWLNMLEGEKTQQRPETLSEIWNISEELAQNLADELVEIGFFEKRGVKEDPVYWVPFLYRDALGMSQGTAS